jgi:hypothetical protein
MGSARVGKRSAIVPGDSVRSGSTRFPFTSRGQSELAGQILRHLFSGLEFEQLLTKVFIVHFPRQRGKDLHVAGPASTRGMASSRFQGPTALVRSAVGPSSGSPNIILKHPVCFDAVRFFTCRQRFGWIVRTLPGDQCDNSLERDTVGDLHHCDHGQGRQRPSPDRRGCRGHRRRKMTSNDQRRIAGAK